MPSDIDAKQGESDSTRASAPTRAAPTDPGASTHDAARRLAALGLKTHWLSAPTLGAPATGKRPLDHGWQAQPYTAPENVPPPPHAGCNLGIRTGRVAGAPVALVAVDLDSPEALAWAREHLPTTAVRTVTAKGEHWFYRYPLGTASIPNRCRVRLPDGTRLQIDVRGDGGQVVVAPSVHYSGVVYREPEPWTSPALSGLPEFSAAWFATASAGAPAPAHRAGSAEPPPLAPLPSEPPTERPGVAPDAFEVRLYEALRQGRGGAAALEALRVMRRGEPYAPPGQRNDTLFQALRLLAEWFPDATDEQLLAYVAPSLSVTGDRGAEGELAIARDTLARARLKYAARDHVVLRLAGSGVPPTQALVDVGADFRTRLILNFPTGSHVVLGPDGGYKPTPILSRVLAASIAHEHFLGWAERAGLAQFSFTDEQGNTHAVKFDTILRRHSTPVTAWRGSFTATASHVDGECFVEAVAPRRTDLTPQFDPTIDQWLRLLGGRNADKLLDWLATFPELETPTAALWLLGARRAGKNLLVDGLARLWRHGAPSPYESTVGDFNEALLRCPLLFADESLPNMQGRRTTADAHLRQLVTQRYHELNRKFLPKVTVEGCLRIVVAMNHSRIVFDNLNEESKAALAERLLVIEVPPAARDYLDSLGGAAAIQHWTLGDGIARHVLWLAETRQVQRGSRLLVEGNGADLINRAANAAGTSADVCQWLCGWLQRPTALTGPARDFVVAGNGELWVSAELWHERPDCWELFVRHAEGRLPSATALGRALGSLSGGTTRQRAVSNGHRHTFHRIDLGQLFGWAERTGFGDLGAMRAAVGVAAEPALPALPAAPRSLADMLHNSSSTEPPAPAPAPAPAPEPPAPAPAPAPKPKRQRRARAVAPAPAPAPPVPGTEHVTPDTDPLANTGL